MARARNIKFSFFTNDELVELPFETRLLFIGLWCIADREGRLVDRPKKIKMEVFPSDDVDCEKSLALLAGRGFINRYRVGIHKVIEILKFIQHQKPHSTEKDSALPDAAGFLTVNERSKNGGVTGVASKVKMAVEVNNVKPPLEPVNPASDNALNVECGMWNPDLLNPDLLNPEPLKEQPPAPAAAAPAKKAAEPKDEPNPLNLATWQAYKQAYTDRYSVAPIRDAATNAKIKSIVKGLGEEGPPVAAFFVSHNGARYVAGMHQIGFMATDYAKLRTEWATNTRMTQTKAQQADKTATNLDAFAPLIAEARAREEAERGAQ